MVGLRRHATAALGAAMAVAGLAGAVPAAASGSGGSTRIVVTTGDDDTAARVGRELKSHGAKHVRPLPLVHGFAAEVPSRYVPQLRREPGVRSVTVDERLKLMSTQPLGYDPATDFGSLEQIGRVVRADSAWNAGYTGKGVGVALIDSGVVPVQGLTSGNVVNGPDLSFESQNLDLRYLDTFGHGTHMASIIAGRDAVRQPTGYARDTTDFNGIAPDARLVSVKVADHSGATDVSQVIAAIDWVVAHRYDNGLNIRVLNLSFGTDSTQPYQIDPLCFAIENAWRKGIVVVVAGGNNGSAGRLTNPAYDPHVIAVGAEDPGTTVDVEDDTVPAFSSRGSATRYVDLVAPGMHVLGLRSPGSWADTRYPAGRVGTRFFRGSGTSQSTAVVSGAAAVLLQRYPSLTPDQVKKHLTSTATAMPSVTPNDRGSGVVNLRRAVNTTPAVAAAQGWLAGTGSGSLEAARGTHHVGDATAPLTGEVDIFGVAFNSASWAQATANGTTWEGGNWLGNAWSGNAWSGEDWTGNAWSGNAWSRDSWSGNAWSDASWLGHAWSSDGWSGNAWSDSAWSGAAWSGTGWSGAAWSSVAWS